MTTMMPMSGARMGAANLARRLVARALARDLTAFVAPGLDVARAYGLDPAAAGLRVVLTPRHAAVLLLVGETPLGLRAATAVVYAQMARPRAIIALGTDGALPLPTPDVAVTLDQAALVTGVEELRRIVASAAWSLDAPIFDAPDVQPKEDDGGGMDHADMDMGGNKGDMDMSGIDHGDIGDMNHGDMDHGDMDHDTDDGGDSKGHGGDDTGHGGGDRGGMDMDMDGGGMSMVMMTKDLPRSPDGLPMEWVEAPVGPLFPGLPGGLDLSFTLDGDVVAAATVAPGTLGRGLDATWAGPVATLPERLALLDPFAPVSYRLLAIRALENAVGVMVDATTADARVGALERERAASHLGWLALFAGLLGDRWIEARAAALYLALRRVSRIAEVERLRGEVGVFARRVRRTPYLHHRLVGIGTPRADKDQSPGGTHFMAGSLPRGPVARAAGQAADARTGDPVYQRLGFAPVECEGNDAWSRLDVRLGELERSLDLVLAVGAVVIPESPRLTDRDGSGTATVETPRGAATLSLAVEGGMVREVMLDTPSMHNRTLIEKVAEGRELADALVGVASLDLSPWEMDR